MFFHPRLVASKSNLAKPLTVTLALVVRGIKVVSEIPWCKLYSNERFPGHDALMMSVLGCVCRAWAAPLVGDTPTSLVPCSVVIPSI
ncbi:hypothetical protein EV401DRAFT_1979534 [Pisolithus croceorrhizus]|nr:hypothetical protein EV401DRAFT_1979534 [Pisolithus croceorrhizus]